MPNEISEKGEWTEDLKFTATWYCYKRRRRICYDCGEYEQIT